MFLRWILACSTLFGANFIPNAIVNLGIEASVQRGVAMDSDGNFYVLGKADNHATLVKVNPAGRILYSKNFGEGYDIPTAIAVDSTGAAYIAVTTSFRAASLTKLSPDGSTIMYSTALAGLINAVAVDPAGNAYVTGDASSAFNPTPGAFQTTPTDAPSFVAKIAPDGASLIWSTFLSGKGIACDTLPGLTCPFLGPRVPLGESNIARAIAVDASGNVYVAGSTNSANFPVTASAYQTRYADPRGVASQGFVVKLSADGSSLIYSTYIGTADGQDLFSLAVDSQGSAIAGGSAGFAAKLDPQGSSLVYSTHVGNEQVSGIATDTSGNAFMTGVTYVNDRRSSFFAELDANGASLNSTLLPDGAAAQGIVASDHSVAVLGFGVLTALAPGDATQPAALAFQNVAGPSVIGLVAPGELVRITGVNLGPNTTVKFDGVRAPILASAENQLDIQVPFEISGRPTTTLQIGESSQTLSLEVTPADPAIYTTNGFNLAVAVNPDGTLNAPDHAAGLGGEAAIFATGGGVWADALSTGDIIPEARLAQIPITVLVASRQGAKQYQAAVVYAGSSPTRSNGIIQVNFILPDVPDFFVSPDSGTGIVWITLRIGSRESAPLAIVTGRP